MQILVVNCGSSSIKADLIEPASGRRVSSVRVERVGSESCALHADGTTNTCVNLDHAGCLEMALPKLMEAAGEEGIAGVGHRVVHGGERFSQPVRINADVEREIEELIPLAPIHNPANLAGIRAARRLMPDIPHIAVFDTAFHATLPRRAKAYAIPTELAKKHGIRRFGFHGTSHAFVANLAAKFLGGETNEFRLITVHLGNGCSAAAVEYGSSVETSMGMTPLEGLVMGTRPGDLDPGALLALGRAEGLDLDGLDHLMNEQCGLKGLSGVSNDLRDIEDRASSGDNDARLAIQVFSHRVRKYIGAYAAVMGGVDAIVFTGGIGENSALIRHRVSQRLDFLGAVIDEDLNREVSLSRLSPVFDISTRNSRAKLLVVATDEERRIAQEAKGLIMERDKVNTERTIPIAVSARHVHLTQEVVEQLFGHDLTVRNPLSQPGQYSCNETVDLVGPKRTIKGVRVLGPPRSACQVEVSRTDEFFLGLDAPVRNSGDVENSPGITLVGPNGRVTLKEGVICAWRHIHMTPEDAEAFGVHDRDRVEVSVNSPERDLTFGDVIVRVSPNYRLEMHLDTDEANAANISRGSEGMLASVDESATLMLRRMRAK